MEESNEMQMPAATPIADTSVNPDANTPEPAEETVLQSEAAPAVEENQPAAEPVCEEPTPVCEQPASEAPAEQPTEAAATEAPAPAAEEAPTQPAAFVEPEADYSNCSREELLAALEELLSEKVEHIKNRVSLIRQHFNTLNKEVEKAAFDAFIAEGGVKEEYQSAPDATAVAFHKAYGRYRELRQAHLDAVEAEKQKNLEAKRAILDELRQLVDRDEETLKQRYNEFNALQERWKGIGDVPRDQVNDLWQNYHFLIEQFFNKINQYKELRQLDLKRNLEQKIVLCEKVEELVLETSITKAFKGLQDLRAQWREIGPVPTEQNDDIWQRFCNAANQIDERRKAYYDQRKEEFDKNLLAKQALIEKATELTQETPTGTKGWNDTTAALDELLKIWKTIGPVPHEQNETIWSQFKGIIDKHYDAKKAYFAQIRDEQSENYNKKVDLCLKAEAIAKREDWKKATDELLQLQKEWKTIGAVSRKASDKIWQRFRGACDEFFNKKEAYFSTIREGESENLAKKEAIIAELKAYQFGDSKEENLEAIKDFQRRWAEIGFVPIAEKARLQKEFRDVINAHFENLKISMREAEENAYRERIRNVAGDARKFINSEKDELVEKIEKLRSDLNLWENNLGFLSSSRQADLLKQEFEKKMQSARQQIALLEAKLRILREEKKEENKEEE